LAELDRSLYVHFVSAELLMRVVLLTSLILVGLGACNQPPISPKPAPAAAPEVNDSIHGDAKQVVHPIGLFTIPDRSVLCEVAGDRLVCDNSGVAVECDARKCTAYHFASHEGPTLPMPEAKAPGTPALPAKTLVDTGFLTCWIEATYIECHLVDYLGGFAMSELFVRNSSFDDAPPGWPWDGRRYTNQDRLPGI